MRPFVRLLAALTIFLGAQASLAQTTYTIKSAKPSSIPAGSATTAFTLTAQGAAPVAPEGYRVCFYPGINTAPLTSSITQATTGGLYTLAFNVPSTSLTNVTTALLYLAVRGTKVCNGTNTDASSTFNIRITADYTITSVTPSPIHNFSSDTQFTLTGKTLSTNAYKTLVCFYSGNRSTAITPKPFDANGATFTVPGSSLSVDGFYDAQVYLVAANAAGTAAPTCTGTNPNLSNSFTVPISVYSIFGANPKSIPAGSPDTPITLSGTVYSKLPLNYGLCFYTGTASTAISPTGTIGSTATFTIPASSLHVVSGGAINSQLYLAPTGSACNGTSSGISNTFPISVVPPSLGSLSLSVLPQLNPNLKTAYPISIEAFGGNFVANPLTLLEFRTHGTNTFSSTSGGRFVSSTTITGGIPYTFLGTASAEDVIACPGDSISTCSTSITIPTYALASSTTTLTPSNPAPAFNQAIDIAATITPGAGSTTAGGAFVPGVPGGTITFMDGTTTLGTGKLVGSSLSFKPVSGQSIATGSNTTSATGSPSPFNTITADFNQDGVPDLLLVQNAAATLHLFLGSSPTGNLQAEQTIANLNYCYSLPGIAAADLNGDGYPDLAILCGNSGGYSDLMVMLNLGDGTFGESLFYNLMDASGSQVYLGDQIAVGDFNHDGKMDLVVTGPSSPNYSGYSGGVTYGIRTLIGDGAAGFTAGKLTPTTDETGTQLIAADLNNDKFPDLTLLHYNTQTQATEIKVYQNDGSGAFTAAATIPVSSGSVTSSKLFVTPLTTTSLYPDITLALPGTNPSVIVARNQRSSKPAFIAPNIQPIAGLTDAVLGDFDGDGFADLAYSTGTFGSPGTVTALSGDGKGKFTAKSSSPKFTSSLSGVNLLAAPDLNLDGFADLVTYQFCSGSCTFVSHIADTYVTSGTSTATATATFATSGAHTVTTDYPGNVNILGSNGSTTITVPAAATPAAPNIQLLPPPGYNVPSNSATIPYVPNTPLSLQVNIIQATTDKRTVAFPTGTITFIDNGVNSGSSTLGSPVNGITFVRASFSTATGGVHNIVVQYSGDTNFLPTSSKFTYTVTPIDPSLTWATPAAITTTTPLPSSDLNASSNGVAGTFAYTPAAGAYLPAGSNILSAAFTPTDKASYNTKTITQTITVNKVLPSSSLANTPANQTYKSATPTVITLTILGTHFTPTGTAQFFDGSTLLGTAPVTPATSASATSAFSVSTLTAGVHFLTARYLGDTIYSAFTQNSSAYTVGAAQPIITWTPPATILTTTPLNSSYLNATANIPGAPFTYNPPAGTYLTAGVQTLSATFSPTDTTDYTTATVTRTVTVSKNRIPGFGMTVTPASNTYNSGIPTVVTFILDGVNRPPTGTAQFLDGTTILGTAPVTPTTGANSATTLSIPSLTAGQHDFTINYLGDANYLPATSPDCFYTVAQALPKITWTPNPASIPSGTALSAAQLDAIAAGTNGTQLDGTYAYTPRLGTTLPVGSNTIKLVFTPTDTNYSAATAQTIITVIKLTPTITWNPNPSSIPYGTLLSDSQLDATASVPGTFVYSPAKGALLTAGSHSVLATFTPTDTTNYITATKTIPIIVTPFTPTITWPTPAPISATTPLPADRLNAIAFDINGRAVNGTYAYRPQAGTILAAGTQPLAVTFTPADAVDYTSSAASNTISVLSSATTVALKGAPNASAFGQAVVFTATIIPTDSTYPVTGTVDFQFGSISLGTASVTGGVATVSTSTLPVGTDLISATYHGDANHSAGSSSLPQTVLKATPTIQWNPNPSTIPYGTALSSAQLDAQAFNGTIQIPGTFTYLPAAGTFLTGGLQTLKATFVPTDTTDYNSATGQTTITVSPQIPVITWTPAAINQGTALGPNQLNATAADSKGNNVPGTFTYTPPAGTILGAGAQTLTASFTPTDTVDFAPTSRSITFFVNNPLTNTTIQSSANPSSFGQTVILTAIVNKTGTETAAPTGTVIFTEGATQLASLTLASGKATYTTSTLSIGSHIITASYSGDTNYVGSKGTISQVVGQLLPVITWNPSPASIPFGTRLSASQLNATAATSTGTPIAGTFAYTPALGTALPLGPNTVHAVFTPTNTTIYGTATQDAVITVVRATPAIVWPALTPIAYGTPLSATQLNAVANDVNGATVPGTYAYSPASGTILPGGTNPLNVTFTPTNPLDYTPTTATNTLQVNPSKANIFLFATLDNAVYGDPVTIISTVATYTNPDKTDLYPATGTVALTLNGTSFGTLTLNRGTASLITSSLPVGKNVITGTYSGDASHLPGTATFTETILPIVPVITWNPSPATISYGTALVPSQLNAIAKTTAGVSIPGTFAYTPDTGAVLDAGSQTLHVAFTPTDTTKFQTLTGQTVITVTKATPTLTWLAISPITQGTALSATQLNATAVGVDGKPLAGLFTYTPPATTVLQPGLQTLTAAFTPTNTLDYTAATLTNTIQVNSATTTTTLTSTPNPSTYQQPITLTATVGQTGTETAPLTGTVTLRDTTSNTILGTSPAGTGKAVFSVATLTVGTHNLVATYAGDPSYTASTSNTVAQVVNTSAASISWTPEPATITYGTALAKTQLNAIAQTTAGATIPGTYAYTPNAGTILDAGTQTLHVTFTPTDTTNFQTLTGQTVITVTKAIPTLTWPAIAPITQGTALSSTQLNATAIGVDGKPLAGLFTYTPSATTVLQPGLQSLTAAFVPTNTLDYTVATLTNTIRVNNATTTTTLTSTPNPSTYQQPITLTATIAQTGTETAAFTGTVTLEDTTSNTILGTSPAATGKAVFSIATLTVGTHTIVATYAGDTNYTASTSNPIAQVVNTSAASISWTPEPAAIPYGTALAKTQLNAIAKTAAGVTIPGTYAYTPNAGTILDAGTQTLHVTFTPTDTTNFQPLTGQTVITITKATPTLTWPPIAPITQGTALSATQLNATATGVDGRPLAGLFTYTPPATTVLQPGLQSLIANFTPTNSLDYTAATLTNTIQVNNATTTTTLTSTPNPSTYQQPITLTATIAQSGTETAPITGTVTFKDTTSNTTLGTAPVTTGKAILPISTLTAGTHILSATYSGDTNYVASTTLTGITQVVTPILPVITFIPAVATIPSGTALGPDQLNAKATDASGTAIPGLFTYTPPSGTILPVGPNTVTAKFTPTDTVNYQSASKTATITVTKLAATTKIAWPTPAPITYGTLLSATQLDAVAQDPTGKTVPGKYLYTPTTGALLPAGSNVLNVTFTPDDPTSFTPATGSTTLTVNPVATTTTLTVTPAHIAAGRSAALSASVSAASGLPGPGTITFFDGTTQIAQSPGIIATITLPFTPGTHSLTARFTATPANFSPSTSPAATLLVNGVTPTLTFNPTPASIVYGTPLASTELDAIALDPSGAKIPGTFTYDQASGTILKAGPHTITATFHPTDTVNFAAGTIASVITVTQATPVITWPALAPINQGTPLSATQLDATATGVDGKPLPGLFTYTPAVGATLNSGLQTLHTSFTPEDTVDYITALATNTLQVNSALSTTTLKSSLNPSTFGQSVTLTATVTRSATQTAPITGTITFTDTTKGTILGSAPVTNGLATLTTATLSAGTHAVQAAYSGDTTDLASTSAILNQVVSPTIPILTWNPTLTTITYGTLLTTAELNATATTATGTAIDGAYKYTPALGTRLKAGPQTLSVTFTPTDTTSFQTVTAQTVITVTRATPSIAWPAPAAIPQGTALSSAQLNAVASDASGKIDGLFTYTPPAGTIPNAGVLTLTAAFAPTDATDYNPATATNSLNVTQSATTTTVLNTPNPSAAGQVVTLTATVTKSATATAPITGNIDFTEGSTLLGSVPATAGTATLPLSTLAVGTHTIVATYRGDTNNLSSHGQVVQTVNSTVTTITWTPIPATIVYGTGLVAGQFDAIAKNTAGAKVAGAFTYTPAIGFIPQAGNQTLTAHFTPTDAVANAASDATTTITVTRATPTITWATPASINQGTPLSKTQLNAVIAGVDGKPLAGTATYTPDFNTILPAGTQRLTVLFTPSDAVDYTTATASVLLNVVVNPATQTLLTSSINPSQFGQPTILTAAVSRIGTLTTLITGTVTFFDGDTPLGKPVALALPSAANGPNTATLTLATLGTGTHKLTAIYSGDTTFATSTSTLLTQTITIAPTALTWVPTVATIPYGTALSSAQLDAVANSPYVSNVPGTILYDPASGILNAGVQILKSTFTPNDAADFLPSVGTTTVTVTKATPTLTWTPPAAIAQGTALSATQLDAQAFGITGSKLDGAYTYTPAAGTILQAGTATLSVLFTPTDTLDYTTRTLTVPITVSIPSTKLVLASSLNPAQFAQPVTFTATISQAGTSTQPITGTITFSDSGKPIGSAPITGSTATLTLTTLTPGSHSITAAYAGSTNYAPSTSNLLTEVIAAATTTIQWTPNPATIVYGAHLSAAQLNATASSAANPSVPGTFLYTPDATALLTAGIQTLKVAFTPTDTTSYAPATGTTTITVTKATPALTWTPPAAIPQGTALSATQLDAQAFGITGTKLDGAYTYTPAAGTILQSGTTTLSVLFTPTDTVNYTTRTFTIPITVSIPATKLSLTSSLNPAQFAQIVTFTATISQTGTSTQPITGTISFSDAGKPIGSAAITGSTATLALTTLTPGSHAITASYAGSTNYAPSTSNVVTEVIAAATTTIQWTPNPATIVYGAHLSAAQLNATASSAANPSVPGTFLYTPDATALLTAGVQTLKVAFTPTDSTSYAPSTGTTTITVTKATPTLTWTPPAAIPQGTALSATQLDAQAFGITGSKLDGTYTYTPAAGTILQAGTTTLSVLFTPTDTVDYTTRTLTVPITVNVATASTILTSLTNPSQYGQSTTLSATITRGGTTTGQPTGSVTFYDGTKLLGTATLSTSGIATLPISTLTAGDHVLTAAYAGDTADGSGTSGPLTQVVTRALAVITFVPNPATIVFGTPLTAAQLDATATSLYIASVPGAFTYTAPQNAILPAGVTTVTATFTPTDAANFTGTTKPATITVTKANPTLTFPTPPTAVVGSALSDTQLAAFATGVTGAKLAGTYTYSPAKGTIITAGPQTLHVTFTPTDAADYNTATATTILNGTAVSLTALDRTTGFLGDPATTITLTGTGFVTNSIVRSNGTPLATTYVNPTTLRAVLPADTFLIVQTLQISIADPDQAQTTAALPFTITAPKVVFTVSAPATAAPGEQPSITLNFANPYPVPVTATFTLTFKPLAGGVVDPNVKFPNGKTAYSFDMATGATTSPAVQIQTGTVAGQVDIALTLQAGNTDVTPAGLTPTVITIPAVVPGLTQVTVARDGRTMTVSTFGYSNTREATQAHFHFTAAPGKTLSTQDLTIDVGSVFAGWYADTASDAYGSEFLYTQIFTLDDDASVVGEVTVTLSNTIGVSAAGNTQ